MSNPGVSLRPSDAVESSKFDDVDVTLKSVTTGFFDYNGKIAAPGAPAIKVVFEGDYSGEKFEFIEHYTAGDAAKLVPSQDGKKFDPVGEASGIGKSTNAMQLITSIINAGFPEDRLTDEVTVFQGLKAHMNRVAQKSAKKADEKDRTVLVVSKILALPGEKVTGAKAPGRVLQGPKPAAQAAAGAAPATTDASDIEALVSTTVMEILAAKGGGPVAQKDLNSELFKKLSTDPRRNVAVQWFYKNAANGPWAYSPDGGGTFSLA